MFLLVYIEVFSVVFLVIFQLDIFPIYLKLVDTDGKDHFYGWSNIGGYMWVKLCVTDRLPLSPPKYTKDQERKSAGRGNGGVSFCWSLSDREKRLNINPMGFQPKIL